MKIMSSDSKNRRFSNKFDEENERGTLGEETRDSSVVDRVSSAIIAEIFKSLIDDGIESSNFDNPSALSLTERDQSREDSNLAGSTMESDDRSAGSSLVEVSVGDEANRIIKSEVGVKLENDAGELVDVKTETSSEIKVEAEEKTAVKIEFNPDEKTEVTTIRKKKGGTSDKTRAKDVKKAGLTSKKVNLRTTGNINFDSFNYRNERSLDHDLRSKRADPVGDVAPYSRKEETLTEETTKTRKRSAGGRKTETVSRGLRNASTAQNDGNRSLLGAGDVEPSPNKKKSSRKNASPVNKKKREESISSPNKQLELVEWDDSDDFEPPSSQERAFRGKMPASKVEQDGKTRSKKPKKKKPRKKLDFDFLGFEDLEESDDHNGDNLFRFNLYESLLNGSERSGEASTSGVSSRSSAVPEPSQEEPMAECPFCEMMVPTLAIADHAYYCLQLSD